VDEYTATIERPDHTRPPHMTLHRNEAHIVLQKFHRALGLVLGGREWNGMLIILLVPVPDRWVLGYARALTLRGGGKMIWPWLRTRMRVPMDGMHAWHNGIREMATSVRIVSRCAGTTGLTVG
jgi:hypothetical protein